MDEILKYGNFKTVGNQKDKKQVILCHTYREVEEYLTSLKFRYNGHYNKIPHYIITRDGRALQLLKDTSNTNFFGEDTVNKNSIIISLENLGWLEKKPLTNYYINWKGSIYNGEVYEKKWRDFFFWQPYTQSQIKTTAELCNQILEKFQINKRCIDHNTKIDKAESFQGIVSRSNFNSNYTDLNPSFNFEAFRKFFENEQFA